MELSSLELTLCADGPAAEHAGLVNCNNAFKTLHEIRTSLYAFPCTLELSDSVLTFV